MQREGFWGLKEVLGGIQAAMLGCARQSDRANSEQLSRKPHAERVFAWADIPFPVCCAFLVYCPFWFVVLFFVMGFLVGCHTLIITGTDITEDQNCSGDAVVSVG